MPQARTTSPSKHTKPARAAPPPTRRVGPSESQQAELPRRRGKRNAVPKRLNFTDAVPPEKPERSPR